MIPAIKAAVMPNAVITMRITQMPAYSRLSKFPYAMNERSCKQLERIQHYRHARFDTKGGLTVINPLRYEVNAHMQEHCTRHAARNKRTNMGTHQKKKC
jgi:hypothetical protein